MAFVNHVLQMQTIRHPAFRTSLISAPWHAGRFWSAWGREDTDSPVTMTNVVNLVNHRSECVKPSDREHRNFESQINFLRGSCKKTQAFNGSGLIRTDIFCRTHDRTFNTLQTWTTHHWAFLPHSCSKYIHLKRANRNPENRSKPGVISFVGHSFSQWNNFWTWYQLLGPELSMFTFSLPQKLK
jgi:hypothetical protein